MEICDILRAGYGSTTDFFLYFNICQSQGSRLNICTFFFPRLLAPSSIQGLSSMKINSINRSELMLQIASKYQLEPKDAELVVRVILEVLSQALITGERIEIRGFGSFELRFRAKRRARNPKTGETVETLPKYSAHFKPGKEMRERVCESSQKLETDTQALTAPSGHGFPLSFRSSKLHPGFHADSHARSQFNNSENHSALFEKLFGHESSHESSFDNSEEK